MKILSNGIKNIRLCLTIYAFCINIIMKKIKIGVILMTAIIEYFKANPLFFWIIAACVVVVLILIIVAIAKAAHKAKRKSSAVAEEESVQPALPSENAAAAKPAPVVQEMTEEKQPAPNEDSAEEPCPIAAESTQQTEEKAVAAPVKADAEKTPQTNDPVKTEEAPAEKTKTSSVNTDQTRVASRPAAEKLLEKASEDEDEDKKQVYTGKWVILKNEDTGSYYFELRASNGEKLLTSIDYTSLSGAKNGIKTHKNNILRNNIVISQNKKKQYFFRLLNGSKQLLCTGETYPTKARCESAVDSVKRFAESAVVTVQKENEESED